MWQSILFLGVVVMWLGFGSGNSENDDAIELPIVLTAIATVAIIIGLVTSI